MRRNMTRRWLVLTRLTPKTLLESLERRTRLMMYGLLVSGKTV